jgi:hypothetical protein
MRSSAFVSETLWLKIGSTTHIKMGSSSDDQPRLTSDNLGRLNSASEAELPQARLTRLVSFGGTTMKVRYLILLTLLCATLILIGKLSTSAHATNQPSQENQQVAQRKIAPWVMEHTENGAEAEFLVILHD